MAYVRLIRVFLSSPNDMKGELRVLKEVAGQINDTDGDRNRFRLELWDWSKGTPQIGPGPQAVVDRQIPEHHVYLGMMSARFGTPTGPYGSGTEKEFRDATSRWSATGRPWILFYFNEKPKTGKTAADAEELKKVREFREELEKLGIVGTYTGLNAGTRSFRYQVDGHLRDVISASFGTCGATAWQETHQARQSRFSGSVSSVAYPAVWKNRVARPRT